MALPSDSPLQSQSWRTASVTHAPPVFRAEPAAAGPTTDPIKRNYTSVSPFVVQTMLAPPCTPYLSICASTASTSRRPEPRRNGKAAPGTAAPSTSDAASELESVPWPLACASLSRGDIGEPGSRVEVLQCGRAAPVWMPAAAADSSLPCGHTKAWSAVSSGIHDGVTRAIAWVLCAHATGPPRRHEQRTGIGDCR